MKGEQNLMRLVVRWWRLVADKASEKAIGDAYRDMTRELEKVTGKVRR